MANSAPMIVKAPILPTRYRNLALGCATMTMVFVVSAAAHADDDCTTDQSATTITEVQPCEPYGVELDLSTPPSALSQPSKPAPKSDAIPWIATDTNDIPATFSKSDTGVSVRTSLGTLRDYNARSASPTIEQPAFGEAPKTDFAMPSAPAVRKTPLDVWTNIDVNGYDGERDQSTRTGLGADYKLSKTTTVGVSVEQGDSHAGSSPGDAQDQKASAYVSLKATPLLSLDARTEWQAGNAEFSQATGTSERSAVILAPKINHDFKLDDGAKVSPYLSYQHEFDVTSSHKEGVDPSFDATQSAGAGITYTKPDAYSLSVSADVDNFGVTNEDQSLRSKFQLSVPLDK